MASYKKAIEWLYLQTDTGWVEDFEEESPTIEALLIAEIFNKDVEKVVKDIRKRRIRKE